jgi:hypothetical protein
MVKTKTNKRKEPELVIIEDPGEKAELISSVDQLPDNPDLLKTVEEILVTALDPAGSVRKELFDELEKRLEGHIDEIKSLVQNELRESHRLIKEDCVEALEKKREHLDEERLVKEAVYEIQAVQAKALNKTFNGLVEALKKKGEVPSKTSEKTGNPNLLWKIGKISILLSGVGWIFYRLGVTRDE